MFYKVLFIIEILVAEFLYMIKMTKGKNFLIKYPVCVLVILAAALFFPIPYNNILDSSIAFLSLFFLTVVMMKICYKESFRNIFFCAIASYNTQHFAYVLSSLALSALVWGRSPILGMYDNTSLIINAFNLESLFIILVYSLCYFLSYWLLFSKFGKKIKKGNSMKIKSLSLLSFIGVGLVVDILLNSFIIYYDFSIINVVIDSLYSLLCCVLLLFGQFSLLTTKELQDNVDIVKHLWHQEKEQFAFSKENIELINMKCHDMRHQIRELGQSKSLSSETISEIESLIHLYDTNVKTGNNVLDIIITEKSLICNKKSINFSCLIDGSLLDFMAETDLYSLFGNAFDNAIEATDKIKDNEKRVISCKIHAVGELITVSFKNAFEGQVNFDDDGLPITTKEDSNYHGFGMQSIAHVVEKYNGDIAVKVKDNIFCLNLLFTKIHKSLQNKS